MAVLHVDVHLYRTQIRSCSFMYEFGFGNTSCRLLSSSQRLGKIEVAIFKVIVLGEFLKPLRRSGSGQWVGGDTLTGRTEEEGRRPEWGSRVVEKEVTEIFFLLILWRRRWPWGKVMKIVSATPCLGQKVVGAIYSHHVVPRSGDDMFSRRWLWRVLSSGVQCHVAR